jgi:hypothetical protein
MDFDIDQISAWLAADYIRTAALGLLFLASFLCWVRGIRLRSWRRRWENLPDAPVDPGVKLIREYSDAIERLQANCSSWSDGDCSEAIRAFNEGLAKQQPPPKPVLPPPPPPPPPLPKPLEVQFLAEYRAAVNQFLEASWEEGEFVPFLKEFNEGLERFIDLKKTAPCLQEKT